MAFSIETWKAKIAERFRTWTTRLTPEPPSLYAAVCVSALWPVVQAASSGELWPALATLGAITGGSLLANVIQNLKDEASAG